MASAFQMFAHRELNAAGAQYILDDIKQCLKHKFEKFVFPSRQNPVACSNQSHHELVNRTVLRLVILSGDICVAELFHP